MTYKLINKNTNTMMRGAIKSREAARMRKRSQKNPKDWMIAVIGADSCQAVRYVR
jgi:hypothetical protein